MITEKLNIRPDEDLTLIYNRSDVTLLAEKIDDFFKVEKKDELNSLYFDFLEWRIFKEQICL